MNHCPLINILKRREVVSSGGGRLLQVLWLFLPVFLAVFFFVSLVFFGGGKKHLREILCFFSLQDAVWLNFELSFFHAKRWASWEAECHFKLKRIRSGTAWSWSWCYFPNQISCVFFKHVFSQVSIFLSSLPMFILSRYVFTYHCNNFPLLRQLFPSVPASWNRICQVGDTRCWSSSSRFNEHHLFRCTNGGAGKGKA